MMNVIQWGYKQVYALLTPCEKYAYFSFSKVDELWLKNVMANVFCKSKGQVDKYTETNSNINMFLLHFIVPVSLTHL